MVKKDPTLAPTPTFTISREVSPPPLFTSSSWPSAEDGTVWDESDIFQYIRSPTPSPEVSPGLAPAQPSRSLTPSPILGVFTAQRVAVPPGPPPPLPPLGFVHHLPTHMPPHSRTATFTTPNGAVDYYAFADADGVAQVCMVASVADMQAIYASLAESQRRGV